MAISQKMLGFAERSSWIRKMFEEGARLKAQYGADQVCDFSLGNPDLPPPAQYQEAVRTVTAAEAPGSHGYMANNGYPFVREAVARQISAEQGMTVGQDDIIMTVGAAGGLNVVMKSLLDPGDEVIILAPFFVEYNFYIDNHGGVAKVVNTGEDFSLDLAAIEAVITPKTKAIIINSPNNPTGQIYSAGELAGLAEVLAKAPQTIYLISDEPYRNIVYDGHTVPSIFKAYGNSLIASSYSKDLSLPGERIGYIAAHPQIEGKPQLLGAMTLANRILGFVNAPALMQRVVAELQGVTVDTSIYTRRRELFCTVLREAGYEFVPPKGAFYMFPKSPIADDAQFVGLLAEEKILGVPGRGFGMEGYFRLAFCVEDAVISRSAEGFKKALAKALTGC
ncbi:MAG: pyridoxal phosphate-dependent aminotransferase [Proteobacteria bacterium]|nr:pyridoxal phosphate-dependent aminotransferase [Pseudomonadota bacterium]MBU1545937.1 pyridoxal phosphate-dependent aminotransferase [Pseudomonadota bacterium]MBU2618498.1 pyridoxal phosphate-dependent aminotransferase [Pseudomonadota bacterium]